MAETTESLAGDMADLKQRLYDIKRLLDEHYGPRRWTSHGRPVDVLIETVLSQNTSDVNSHRAFRALLDRYGSLESVVGAHVVDIEEIIRPAGLSRIKSVRIKHILEEVRRQHWSLDLAFLSAMSLDEARSYLTALPGVGPKTASCVLVFALGMPAMPVDTHVHRVSQRLGLIHVRVSPEEAQAELEAIVEPDDRYGMHLHLIEHGRGVCRARKPACHRCVLSRLCPSAFSF